MEPILIAVRFGITRVVYLDPFVAIPEKISDDVALYTRVSRQ